MDLTTPHVMGILNVTPDSFSDGGRYSTAEQAFETGIKMLQDGATILDIGGESTRPGASPVSVQQELDRVMPVLEKLRAETYAVLSVDTSKPEVMRAAIAAGCDLINDVNALQAEGAVSELASTSVSVCLMHKQGVPETMQVKPEYQDVVQEVFDFLALRIQACVDAGIERSRVWVDPGFGFGKQLNHNLALMKALNQFKALELPVLIGVSRKSMIGTLLDCPVDQRLHGGLAFAFWAMMHGAVVIRTHDVKPTVEMVKIFKALQ